MVTILCPIIELSILLPCMFLAYLPMKQHLRFHFVKLITIITLFIFSLCLTGGLVCYFFNIKILWILFPYVTICGFIYLYTLHVSHWKSVSVFLAICAVFSCLGNIAKAMDILLCPTNNTPYLSLKAALLYILMCWLSVGIVWYPSTHATRKLLEDTAFAKTWYIFWILPSLFIGLNLFMNPRNSNFIYINGIIQKYIIITFILLILLLFFYVMFYFIATNLNKNEHLWQENQFLFMQQAQYDNLCAAIAETKSARHDMRHHFNALQNLANRGEWEALIHYLCEAQMSIPNTELNSCENTAVDGIVSHYAMLCKKTNTPFSIQLDLPKVLPVPEIDLCLVLSNLLENALDASLHTSCTRRQIYMQAYLYSSNVILLTIENTYDGIIKEKDGIFQSSKHFRSGIGTQSIRHIAEKHGGYCRFTYDNGIFCANIMLRGE